MRWRRDWRREWRRDWRGLDNDSTLIKGYGPNGVATLVLDLEQGFTVTSRYESDVQKWTSGKERRASPRNGAKETYSGDAILIGDDVREVRSRLARYAVSAPLFLLGLPHEALYLIEDSAGTLVFVGHNEIPYVDWAMRGQRVVLARRNSEDRIEAKNAVIQSVSGGTIELDRNADFYGVAGCLLMPAIPVFLEPQQNFARYPVNAESWSVTARAALVGYAPQLAQAPIVEDGVPTGAVAVARRFGEGGNACTFERVSADGYPDAGELVETGFATRFNQKPGVTTLGDLARALNRSENFILRGDYDPDQASQLNFGISLIGSQNFIPYDADYALLFDQSGTAQGGASLGRVGTGATLTTYAGDGTVRPVWDRPITVENTAGDSLQALTDILDFEDGLPQAFGKADRVEWGRAVIMTGDRRSLHQWMRLFIHTVRGKRKAFWLPTWRSDLSYVSRALPGGGITQIVVSTTDGSDFNAWFPAQRQHIQVVEANGTVTYAKITAAANNGDGTRTITINAVIASTDVEMISWLELCRFEKDEFPVRYTSRGFRLETLARVVQE